MGKQISFDLEDIIGDVEGVREEIRAAAINMFAESIKRELEGNFKEALFAQAKESAVAKIDGLVEEFLTSPISLTRRYGEPDRVVTAKELIMEEWQGLLTRKVDSNGSPSTYSDAKTVLQWAAQKMLKPEIDAAATDIRKQLATLIDAAFREQVTTGILQAIGLNLKPK